MSKFRRILLLAVLASEFATAQSNMVIQRTPLAGFTYHQGPVVWSALHEGDPLTLIREAANPHDAQAVRVEWQGQTLGYLPRTRNGAVSRALTEGVKLSARIRQLRNTPDPRRRLEIEILQALPTPAQNREEAVPYRDHPKRPAAN